MGIGQDAGYAARRLWVARPLSAVERGERRWHVVGVSVHCGRVVVVFRGDGRNAQIRHNGRGLCCSRLLWCLREEPIAQIRGHLPGGSRREDVRVLEK